MRASPLCGPMHGLLLLGCFSMSLLSMHYCDWESIMFGMPRLAHFSIWLLRSYIKNDNLLNVSMTIWPKYFFKWALLVDHTQCPFPSHHVNSLTVFFLKNAWTSSQNIRYFMRTNKYCNYRLFLLISKMDNQMTILKYFLMELITFSTTSGPIIS